MSEKLTMDVCELAVQLGISRPKAYELVKQSDFPSITLGKRIIIPVNALKCWLEEKSQKAEQDEHSM